MIYLGADHRGFELKTRLFKRLIDEGYEVTDLGNDHFDPNDDYVDFAIEVAQKTAQNPAGNRGIVICGSGVGVDIAANKVRGIRCGLGFAEDQVHAARKDDNINILALASDNATEEEALRLVEKFLETEFVESDKYLRRLEKIERFEKAVYEKHKDNQ